MIITSGLAAVTSRPNLSRASIVLPTLIRSVGELTVGNKIGACGAQPAKTNTPLFYKNKPHLTTCFIINLWPDYLIERPLLKQNKPSV
jgi:hypothetical protein